MSSTQCACDILMEKVSYAVEQLLSIREAVTKHNLVCHGPAQAGVWDQLKDLHRELQSALSEARLAHTTEQQECGKTSSNGISKSTLEAIEVFALQIARSTRILAGSEPTLESSADLAKSEVGDERTGVKEFHHNADGACPFCLRFANWEAGCRRPIE